MIIFKLSKPVFNIYANLYRYPLLRMQVNYCNSKITVNIESHHKWTVLKGLTGSPLVAHCFHWRRSTHFQIFWDSALVNPNQYWNWHDLPAPPVEHAYTTCTLADVFTGLTISMHCRSMPYILFVVLLTETVTWSCFRVLISVWLRCTRSRDTSLASDWITGAAWGSNCTTRSLEASKTFPTSGRNASSLSSSS